VSGARPFARIAALGAALALTVNSSPAADAAPVATVEQRVFQFGPAVERRTRHQFELAGVAYPPRELALLAFKDVRHLELYARSSQKASWSFIKDYRVLGASGTLGPKLAEGDRQVPEGIYGVESLNPNSHYYLSIRIDYPNELDRAMAQREGREKLGGDIMIHGGRGSDGCLAMGNEAIEELFVLAAQVGERHVRVVISPTDFRDPTSRVPTIVAPWLRDLYLELRTELQQYRAQRHTGN
jgi:hypothetical protein